MSTLKVDTLKNGDGTRTRYTVSAWVNFNGQDTVAIRASGNVSSITDNDTGDYTVNFTTAMPDADYAAGVTGNAAVHNDANDRIFSTATSNVRVQHYESGTSRTDTSIMTVNVIR